MTIVTPMTYSLMALSLQWWYLHTAVMVLSLQWRHHHTADTAGLGWLVEYLHMTVEGGRGDWPGAQHAPTGVYSQNGAKF